MTPYTSIGHVTCNSGDHIVNRVTTAKSSNVVNPRDINQCKSTTMKSVLTKKRMEH